MLHRRKLKQPRSWLIAMILLWLCQMVITLWLVRAVPLYQVERNNGFLSLAQFLKTHLCYCLTKQHLLLIPKMRWKYSKLLRSW